jgi:RNA polymerase sigma factor (sigma-70 family)
VEGTSARIDVLSLQQALMARAPGLRCWLAEKIPAHLQGAISVDDLLQEIWIAAFRGLPTFRPDASDSLDRWLTCIAQRIVINAIKSAGRLKRGGAKGAAFQPPDRASSLADLFANVASPTRSPSREAAAGEAVDAVQIALARLPSARRQAIWMRYIEGRSCLAISRAMNRTPGAVNGLLFHGLRQMQSYLGDAEKFFSDVALPLAATGGQP